MTFPASQIALLVQGKLEGDSAITVRSFGKIEEAREGDLTFFANPKYEDYLYTTGASVILLNEAYKLKHPIKATLIRVADPYTAFATLLTKYQEILTQQLKGVQQPSYVSSSATYGDEIFIGAFAYLGENVKVGNRSKIFPQVYLGDNVVVGNNCMIFPGVKIYHDCVIGSDVIIHAGVVIGSDGFGFAPQPDGSFIKIPQIGNVIVEDHVEIGANATIDRATIGSTIIRAGAKLDNLVQIAHNVEVGNSTVIAAQAGISGSTKIGKGVMIGGQAGLAGHLHVSDGSKINAQSGLGKHLKTPGTSVTGSPAYDYGQAIRAQAVARNLPEMEKRIQELEALVKQLLAEKV
jgi:UDP-3-O-[3-hydroxymyristoyl] glucosamine N-acyltransferase